MTLYIIVASQESLHSQDSLAALMIRLGVDALIWTEILVYLFWLCVWVSWVAFTFTSSSLVISLLQYKGLPLSLPSISSPNVSLLHLAPPNAAISSLRLILRLLWLLLRFLGCHFPTFFCPFIVISVHGVARPSPIRHEDIHTLCLFSHQCCFLPVSPCLFILSNACTLRNVVSLLRSRCCL